LKKKGLLIGDVPQSEGAFRRCEPGRWIRGPVEGWQLDLYVRRCGWVGSHPPVEVSDECLCCVFSVEVAIGEDLKMMFTTQRSLEPE
jgi:hypothetical protein